MQFTRRYLLTLGSILVLLVVHGLYAQVSQQLLSREKIERRAKVVRPARTQMAQGPRTSQEAASKFLPHAPWTVDARVKIHADGMHLFFNERMQENSNTEIRLSPVAIVWLPEADKTDPQKKQEPVVLLAESATFQFDEPVELSEIRTELIRQIMLRGRVDIRGQDDLHIVGSNFTFSRASQHLFSDHQLQFRMQKHWGVARNIQLNLEMLDGGVHANNPRVQGIKEVMIREHLELHLDGGEQGPVLVTCEDRFQYQMKEQRALLLGDVFIHQTDPVGMVNDMSSDQLLLQFMSQPVKEATTAQANPAIDKSATADEKSELTLKSLQATGEPVRIRSAANQLVAVGQQFDYDLQTRVLMVRDPRQVRVQYQGADLLTPQLEMHLSEENTPLFAHCTGPGQLQYLSQEKAADKNKSTPAPAGKKPVSPILAQANWRDSLTLAPDPDAPEVRKIVTLTGVATLKSPLHQAGMIAQTLRFWLEKSPEAPALADATPASPSSLPPANSSATPPNPEQMAEGMRMTRALATGDVAVASPQLEGFYETLELFFEQDTSGLLAQILQNKNQPTAPAHSEIPTNSGEIQLASGQTVTPTGQSPAATTTTSGNPISATAPHSPPAEEKPKMNIEARQLTLNVLHDEEFKNMHLAHVKSQGELKATGRVPDQPDAIVISGRGAEIFNQGEGQQRFHLLGSGNQMAWIQNGLLRIDGIDLSLDRGQNSARVLGGGSLQIPINSDLEGMPVGEAQLLQVSWKEQMRFNGSQAYFIGRVRASVGDSVVSCEELLVTLDQPVSLQEPNQQTKPQITQIECRDRVRFEMNHYEESRLMGVRYLSVSTFQANHQTGDVVAQGPGTMEFWQRRTGRSPLGLPEATMSKEPRDAAAPPESGWDYTRLTFAGKLLGNLHQQQATLHEQVNVLHGPVERPLVSFERDARPKQSVWMRCGVLEVVVPKIPDEKKPSLAAAKKADTAEKPVFFELKASQNAEIEADQFLAKADIISYNHENMMIVMRATENRHTTIWHFEHPQAPRSRYDVKVARISPNGNVLDFDRTLGASGSR